MRPLHIVPGLAEVLSVVLKFVLACAKRLGPKAFLKTICALDFPLLCLLLVKTTSDMSLEMQFRIKCHLTFLANKIILLVSFDMQLKPIITGKERLLPESIFEALLTPVVPFLNVLPLKTTVSHVLD